MTKRTASMELRAIREQLNESPPPPPAGATVREWFAGLALMNPELMKDMSTVGRAKEAARLADELVKALAAPRLPSKESMEAPNEAELANWEQRVADEKATKERQSRVTAPALKRARRTTEAYAFDKPPAAATHFRRASDMLGKAVKSMETPKPSGRYSSRGPIEEE